MRLIAAILAALTLAACGGSSASSRRSASVASAGSAARPAPQTTTAQTTTAPSTTATQTESQTGARSLTTTIAGGAPGTLACRAAGLAASFLGQNGGLGHGELGFALRNISSTSCRTYGYPGVLFLDRAGAPLATTTARTTHDFFGSAPAVPLVVAPGSSVSFRLGVTHEHASGSSAGCMIAYGLQVIPPDDTATLRAPIQPGAYECGGASVSPVLRGHSAYP